MSYCETLFKQSFKTTVVWRHFARKNFLIISWSTETHSLRGFSLCLQVSLIYKNKQMKPPENEIPLLYSLTVWCFLSICVSLVKSGKKLDETRSACQNMTHMRWRASRPIKVTWHPCRCGTETLQRANDVSGYCSSEDICWNCGLILITYIDLPGCSISSSWVSCQDESRQSDKWWHNSPHRFHLLLTQHPAPIILPAFLVFGWMILFSRLSPPFLPISHCLRKMRKVLFALKEGKKCMIVFP